MSELVKADAEGIILPVGREDLGKFISDLLKKPRKTDGSIELVFDIGLHDIIDVYALIRQRIDEQHEASYISFVAVIDTEDGGRSRVRNLEEFKTFNDYGNAPIDRILIELEFLIKAPNEQTPHRQSVLFGFGTERYMERQARHSNLAEKSKMAMGAFFVYDVEHTLISLGEDLSRILSTKGRTFEIIDKFSHFWKKGISFYLIALLVFAVNVGIAVFLGKAIGYLFLDASRLDQQGMQLIQALGVYIFSLITTATLTITGAAALVNWFAKNRPSFIQLSPRDNPIKEERLKMHSRKIFYFVVSSLLSLSIGVAASLWATRLLGAWGG